MPVCIAGMHRSGTSMVSRLLNLCGLYLGKGGDLLEPAADNPAGYWENKQFSMLNEKILAWLGGAWDVPPPMEKGWELDDRLTSLRDEAQRLVTHFRGYPVWGWKDPRNTLTLPFWKSVIPDLKIVVCLRHPLAVAWSLHARGHSSPFFGLTLWLSYNRALMATRPADWIVTHYDAYFADPARELRRVVNRLGMEVSEPMLQEACHSVDAPSRHQQASAEGLNLTDFPGSILQLYQTLCAQAEWTDDALVSSEGLPEAPSPVPSTQPLAEDRPAAQLLALEQLLLLRQQAVTVLSTQLEDRERAVASLTAQLQEQAQWQQAHAAVITDLQQELQAARRLTQATAAELENLRRTKFYRLAAFYWRWVDTWRAGGRGKPFSE